MIGYGTGLASAVGRMRIERSPQPNGRPRRFGMQLPVRYRLLDESKWRTGFTESISATGALIRTAEPIQLAEPLVIVVSFPRAGGCLVGRGRLVRLLSTDRLGPMRGAIAIRRYRLRRWERIRPSVAR
jgi:PilZ domain-containing protein